MLKIRSVHHNVHSEGRSGNFRLINFFVLYKRKYEAIRRA